MTTTHEEISKRAREIWEREGRPQGRDKEHWLQAETELRQQAMRSQTGSNIRSEDDAMLKVPAGLNGSNRDDSTSSSTSARHINTGAKEDTGRKRSPRRSK